MGECALKICLSNSLLKYSALTFVRREWDGGLIWQWFLCSSALLQSKCIWRKLIREKYTVTWSNSYWSLSILRDHFIHRGNWLGGKFCAAPKVEGKFFLQVYLNKILLLGIAVKSEISAVDRSATRFLMFDFKDTCVVSCMNLPIYPSWKKERLSQASWNSELSFQMCWSSKVFLRLACQLLRLSIS